jgi:argininosuccinate lyase
MVRALLGQGRGFESLNVTEWRAFSDRFDDDVKERIRPESSVKARRTPQSTAPSAVRAALQETRDWLDATV